MEESTPSLDDFFRMANSCDLANAVLRMHFLLHLSHEATAVSFLDYQLTYSKARVPSANLRTWDRSGERGKFDMPMSVLMFTAGGT
jgi:hypothetical protein